MIGAGLSAADPIPRQAVRLLIVDAADRLLLVHYHDADRGETWWGTVGGGLRDGESHEEAAHREIREETGLTGVEIGAWVWNREHVFSMYDRWFRQSERFYLVRVEAFTPDASGLVDDEARYFGELRWWTIDEMAATAEQLSPQSLPVLLRRLLEDGLPPEPIAVGI